MWILRRLKGGMAMDGDFSFDDIITIIVAAFVERYILFRLLGAYIY